MTAFAALLFMSFSQVLSRPLSHPTALGTTVSAPVYDSSKTPPLFLGVVGIDFTLKALDAALGVNDATSAESFRRVVERSTARCPRLELTVCEVESYRRQSNVAGDDAICNVECTAEDLVPVQEQKCPFVSDYPGDVWVNRDNEFIAFNDKACCRLSESFAEPDATCTASGGDEPPIALIVGVTVGSIVALGLLAAVVLHRRRREPKEVISGFAHANDEEREEEIQSVTTDHSNNNSQRGRLASDRSLVSELSHPTGLPQGLPKVDEPLPRNKDQCGEAGNGNGNDDADTVVAVEASHIREGDLPEIRLSC